MPISTISIFQAPIRGIWKGIPSDYQVYALLSLALVSLILVMVSRFVSRSKPTMTRKQKKLLLDQQEFVASIVKAKKVLLRNPLDIGWQRNS